METKKALSRRDFIKITAVAGGSLLGGKYLIDWLSDDSVTVKDTRVLMGTIINLAVIAENKAAGEAAVAATFAELERQIAIFDHRTAGTPVSMLNAAGQVANPPAELVEVLNMAAAISEQTNGAFDVTIKPLIDLYQNSVDLPDEAAVQQALALVDYRKLQIAADQISFVQPGMAITLDGIAKGYVVDAGVAELKKQGFDNVFVEAGGDLMAAGSKATETPWRVGVQAPREEQSGLVATFNISDQAAATSGDYMQYYSSDLLNHHIIDPRVGHSPRELASVTIVSGRAVLSDALATAVMVMGSEAGMQLIEASADLEGYLITKQLVALPSSGFAAV